MGVMDSTNAQAKTISPEADIEEINSTNVHTYGLHTFQDDGDYKLAPASLEASGVAEVQGIQAVWGKNGKYMLWAG